MVLKTRRKATKIGLPPEQVEIFQNIVTQCPNVLLPIEMFVSRQPEDKAPFESVHLRCKEGILGYTVNVYAKDEIGLHKMLSMRIDENNLSVYRNAKDMYRTVEKM